MKKMFFLMLLFITILGCSNNKTAKTKNEISPQYYSLSGTMENDVRTIDVEAYKFGFNPYIIVINSGEKVRFKFTTLDVTHGFRVEDLGINVKIEPGKESVFEFNADIPGTYEFKCSVFCGSGHRKMKGWLIIK